MASEDRLRTEVLSALNEDRNAAEFSFALFSAALLSYRKNACLRPCPHINDGDYDADHMTESDELDTLLAVFDTIPSVGDLEKCTLSKEAWKLLHWICCNKVFTVQSCNKKDVLKEIKEKTGESSFSLQPDNVFEVMYKSSGTQRFDELKEQYGTKHGYHGSRMDNFYSIVSNGLQVHMMKNGLFGEGIYLTDDLAVTMPYTKPGTVWRHSRLGRQLSCVALCELIDHPGVKCQVENDVTKKRSTAKNSESGEVPDRYYVVTNSELVRVKYVLVFTDQKPENRKVKKKRWICQEYPVATILCFYAFFLVLMSVWKSQAFQNFRNRTLRFDDDDD